MNIAAWGQRWQWALCALLCACGGGGGETPAAATEVAAGQSAQQSLGAAGGTLNLATREGASFTLEVPAGALPAATELRLVTATASTRQRFHLRLEPAGLVLEAGRSATLTITLPAAMALPAGAVVAYDGVPMPVQRLADGRLQLRLAAWAGTPAAAAASGRAFALSARRLATTAPPCGGAPAVGDFAAGGLTGSAVAELDIYGQCMVGAVQALADSGAYEAAVRAALATAALLQAGGVQGQVGNGTALAFVTQASRIACSAQRSAIDTAEAATVQGPDHVRRHGQPVLMWQKVIEQLGALCTQVSPTEYTDTLRLLVQAALDWFVQQFAARINNTGSADYAAGVAAAQGHRTAVRELASLPATSSSQVDATARQQIGERAQNGLIDALVQGPWQRCRDGGHFDELARLLQLGNAPPAVKQAAQYCSTLLQARSFNSAGSATATLQPGLGGVRAGQQHTAGSINVDRDGRLELSGPIGALQCPAGQAGGSESLEIKLGNTVLQVLAAAPYLASPLQIDIAQALQAAGLNASTFTSATLTLTRTGSPCGGFWGESPQPLLSLSLSSGICTPAAGHGYCYTVVELPVDPIYHHALAFNARGEVLYERGASDADDIGACQPSDAPRQKSCGTVWRAGSVRELPARFRPVGLADDGTVAGNQLEGSTYGTTLNHPAVVPAGGSSSIRLATSTIDSSDSVGSLGYAMASISPAGRVTYFGASGGYSNNNFGYCTRPPGDTQYFCRRYTFHETSGPGWGAGSLIREDRLPASSDSFGIVYDGDASGRVGSVNLGSAPSTVLAMKDFAAGAVGQNNLMVDDQGRVLWQSVQDGRRGLTPDHASIPAGWQPRTLGRSGHALLCSAEEPATGLAQVRTLNLRTGVLGDVTSQQLTFSHAGHTVNATVPCGSSFADARWIDPLGRLLAHADSDTNLRVRNVILTPRGVALP